MESSPNPTVQNEGDALATIRAAVIGNRKPIAQIAEAIGCCERSVYILMDRYRIPYIKVLNRRYADPAHIGRAILAEQANTPPRGPGRPRKAA